MREAVGNTFIVNLVIIFVIIFIVLFVGSTSYTKAYKVKTRIINIIEENDGNIGASQAEIDKFLGDIGYRIVGKKTTCPKHYTSGSIPSPSNGYRYCIETFDKGGVTYYGVTAYMYFEIPIIGAHLELPVYGETKSFPNV